MKYLKKFESFMESQLATQPGVPATKPGVKPGVKPTIPSPIRRDKPAVEPDPKAKKNKLKKATIEQVIEKYAKLTNQKI